MLDLSIITINYKTNELTRACIDSVKKYTKDIKFETIIIDNSEDNRGFAGGNNVGIKKAKGRYILLLNSDTYLHDDVLSKMVSYMDKNPEVGISSCSLKNVDGTPQVTGGHFPTLVKVLFWMVLQDFPGMEGLIGQFHPKKNGDGITDMDWVGGTFFMIRHDMVRNVGLFDDSYFMYTEEVDFCFRAKKLGWRVSYAPVGSITHIGGASSKSSEFVVLSEIKGIKIFFKKHFSKWQYPILRLILKIGALGRIILFGILKGGEYAKIYAKAFWQA
ncbi:MAG: glycosyltransferase family 2 protein [Patescibacteria group bacterium]